MSDLATGKVTAEDIRVELVELGLTREQADAIKGKANLSAKRDGLTKQDEDLPDLDEAQIDIVEDEVQKTDTIDIISIDDPKWNDFVLSQLTTEEKVKDNPTVDGLRRVAQQLIGPIINMHTHIVQAPTPENEKRATVTVYLKFNVQSPHCKYYGNIEVMGSADSYWGNTDKIYRNHPTAVAETRAEGRALRRILRLRKVIAAEEQADETEMETLGMETVGKITQPQISYLEITCRDKLGINVRNFINKELPMVKNVINISHAEALGLFKVLSSYQATGVPEDLQGYDGADWKTNLTGE